ncbi:alpha-L-glutamate ligase-like protein [Vulgatibacter incomptus]|uniref:Alpha-L-glutamate ligase family protein n=1 Tax=Vulgatibacter incomptus TaxID=1391653 RepID=A0A0K1P9K5_9BACT|nr:alpha-L-glutamate ligase-like protein [Vulgatibacter incomptus]AKU90197.1 Alpha-L-glutamate ligase family protein [Vulgatibacter incomptus]
MFGLFDKLKGAGVLGINARNARFISKHNPRRLFPLVDDKLRSKALCLENGIPAPELYGVVEAHGDLRELPELLAPYREFVIKPVRGAMGNGVLVVVDRDGPSYVKSSGVRLDEAEVRHYVSGILSGLYSLSGTTDRAMVEYRVQLHPVFGQIAYGGVPDVRVIVFKGVPALAMLRLPTSRSDGRANLHQGAIAAGIDLATGRTHHAVQSNRLVETHPDTGNRVIGVQVPRWEEILRIAAVSAEMTGLGYIGVDVVLDATQGPLLLELNARPGLAIQIANFQGLLGPLTMLERVDTWSLGVDQRIELAKEVARELRPRPLPEATPALEKVG